jgi:hypothetical protein
MGANLVGFVLGVDGAQYFAHELIGSWDGMSLPETFLTLQFVDRGKPQEFAFSSLHARVYLLAYNSCLSIGMFVI